jgi:hypothetical protein
VAGRGGPWRRGGWKRRPVTGVSVGGVVDGSGSGVVGAVPVVLVAGGTGGDLGRAVVEGGGIGGGTANSLVSVEIAQGAWTPSGTRGGTWGRGSRRPWVEVPAVHGWRYRSCAASSLRARDQPEFVLFFTKLNSNRPKCEKLMEMEAKVGGNSGSTLGTRNPWTKTTQNATKSQIHPQEN